MGVVPCAVPCRLDKNKQSLFTQQQLQSSSSTDLSTQSSLSSLPSLSSLSSSNLLEKPSTTYYHCISTLKGHSSYVFSLILAGKHLYSGSYDNEIRAWSRSQDPIAGHGQGNNINNVVATGDRAGAVKSLVVLGDRLFGAQQDCKIRVWKIIDPSCRNKLYQCIATLPTLSDRFFKLIFSAKNHVQEVGSYKTAAGRRRTWIHHVDSVSALSLSRDGTRLYSASWDRTFKVWQTSNLRCLESVAGAHDDAINALVVSSDGYVYTGSADMKIKVWKLTSTHHYQAAAPAGKKKKKKQKQQHLLVATLEKHKSAVNALALSNDGRVLYSGACDRSILVWEKEDEDPNLNLDNIQGGHMRVVGVLRGHAKAILCLTVVLDLLLSGSADNTVRIWKKPQGSFKDSSSYACFAVLQGHTRPIKCLAAAAIHDNNIIDDGNKFVSGNGNTTSCLVYTGSLDHDIRVWKVSVPLF